MPRIDTSPESFTYSTTIPVRWSDMDSMGHVNNACYITYFQQARCDYLAQWGIYVRGGDAGPVIARAQCRYRAQVSYPATIRVYLRPVAVRASAFRFEYAVYNDDTGELAADGDTLLIWVDFTTGKRAPLPKEWLDILK